MIKIPKFEVPHIILMSFRWGNFTPTALKQTSKKSTQNPLSVTKVSCRCSPKQLNKQIRLYIHHLTNNNIFSNHNY